MERINTYQPINNCSGIEEINNKIEIKNEIVDTDDQVDDHNLLTKDNNENKWGYTEKIELVEVKCENLVDNMKKEINEELIIKEEPCNPDTDSEGSYLEMEQEHTGNIHVHSPREKEDISIPLSSKVTHENGSQLLYDENKKSDERGKQNVGSNRRFYCVECQKTFSFRFYLLNHKCIHIKERKHHIRTSSSVERRHVCEICQKSFDRISNLKQHKLIHSEIKTYSCDVCNKKFAQISNLFKHKRIHAEDKPYICDICERLFTEYGNLKKHKRVHSGEKPYACDVCQKTFSDNGNLKQHKRIHNGEKPFTCDICRKAFSQISNLKTHKRIHKENSDGNHKNGECNAAESSNDGIKRNNEIIGLIKPPIEIMQVAVKYENEIDASYEDKSRCSVTSKDLRITSSNINKIDVLENKNAESRKRFTCNECHNTFSNRLHLKRHSCIHINESIRSKEKQHVCNICQKTYKRFIDLNKHKAIHSGEKAYACNVCQKIFTYIGKLNKHKLTHSGEKPFTCGICKKSFSEYGNLKQHQRIHNGEKPYSCDVCQKSFTLFGNLKKHKRIHIDGKPFSCDICKRKFNEISNLNNHKRIHIGEKPYKCDVCQATFSNISNLYTHKRIHKKRTNDHRKKNYSGICAGAWRYPVSDELKITEQNKIFDCNSPPKIEHIVINVDK